VNPENITWIVPRVFGHDIGDATDKLNRIQALPTHATTQNTGFVTCKFVVVPGLQSRNDIRFSPAQSRADSWQSVEKQAPGGL
jgi:hypothetical protein